ncbi:cadmium resistance transporter [Aneurinibacillus sp. Ricciae_BoGa-3]|uniref:cadmium resistance transporter n=1 Tax=Aneurinibacillus sp. Ricciae_BoGa-3 TaxID=3022697 RepID=UPI00233FB1BE|nr:cadmium resistance transporter [Aneurinibacillus sp. Ricciae_BoGa-3]WCK54896.1 cadmium resistance transporter [Aneurinibacillus sp. Ricciae_BoGa-3]
MIKVFLSGIFAFIATNVDDLFILVTLFSQTNDKLHKKHIVVGQYLGFSALILVSLLASLGALFIPKQWIGLLGFLPLYMAYKLWREHGTEEKKEDDLNLEIQDGLKPTSFWRAFINRNTYKVATITFANCSDNFAIYIPIFSSASLWGLAFIVSEFMLLLGIWCYLGFFFTKHPVVAKTVEKYGHILLPFVLVFLGIYIIISSETFKLLGL